MRRAAEALDCTLVYALVPNETSLENAVHARARKIALRDLGRVAHTMRLEAQGTGDADLEARIDRIRQRRTRKSETSGMSYDGLVSGAGRRNAA